MTSLITMNSIDKKKRFYIFIKKYIKYIIDDIYDIMMIFMIIILNYLSNITAII